MKLTRRNALTGLGGLAVGGGALLGSGAFSTVEASRDVEVNVVTDNEIANDERFADIIVHVAEYETVAVDDGSGDLNTDGSGLFPTDDGAFNDATNRTWSKYVSLIQNDVSLVFGFDDGSDDRRLLPNAEITYADLISLVNTNDSETDGEHTLTFDNTDFSEDTEVEFDSTLDNVQVSGDTIDDNQVNVTTGTGSDTGGTLDITITDST